MAAVLALHLGFLAWNVFGVQQNLEVTGSARSHGAHSYGGRWKYLTFINQVLQTVFFAICVLSDLAPLVLPKKKKLSSFLLQLRDGTFAVLAFPIGVFVVASFWGIYAYDRELVYPKVLDSIIPQWLNHCMHTVVLPLLLVELYACSHRYPSRKWGISIMAAFSLLYMAWVLWIHHASGIWVYPLLAKLDAVGLAVFFAGAMLITVPFYCLGELLTWFRWGTPRKPPRKRKAK